MAHNTVDPLELEPGMEVWRSLTNEYLNRIPRPSKSLRSALRVFLTDYLQRHNIHALQLSEFFSVNREFPSLQDREKKSTKWSQYVCNSIIHFLEWVLYENFTRPNPDGCPGIPHGLMVPFPRTIKFYNPFEFDSKFNFLLKCDPAFEEWRVIVAEYWESLPMSSRQARRRNFLVSFLLDYLWGKRIYTLSISSFFSRHLNLPDLDVRFMTQTLIRNWRISIGHFLDWVYFKKVLRYNEAGLSGIPADLHNPFTVEGTSNYINRTRPDFVFVLRYDSGLNRWRSFAAEYLQTFINPASSIQKNLALFLLDYLFAKNLHKLQLDLFFSKRSKLPDLENRVLNKGNTVLWHKTVAGFLDWVLQEKLLKVSSKGAKVPPGEFHNPFLNPFVARKEVMDPSFSVLTELDPEMENWRQLASEYFQLFCTSNRSTRHLCLRKFCVSYLRIDKLYTLSLAEFFSRGTTLPDLESVMRTSKATSDKAFNIQHDIISDFISWILYAKVHGVDVSPSRKMPPHPDNPFPRRNKKPINKLADLDFLYFLDVDPGLEDWRALAAEWLKLQAREIMVRRTALEKFILSYIHGRNAERNYGKYLLRKTEKPDVVEALAEIHGQRRGNFTPSFTRRVNLVADFIDWILESKLGDPESGTWDRNYFHNPVTRLRNSRHSALTESNKTSLSMRFISKLREMLAEGINFRDWKWAQTALSNSVKNIDWFVVDPSVCDPDDPDCVFRTRSTTTIEQKSFHLPDEVCEMWSPVRALVLYIKLLLPLRTMQVRMLDSGEADTWRYVYDANGGSFEVNRNPLVIGTQQRPYQRGVFHRKAGESEPSLYINTNKTADIKENGRDHGYVIPWAHNEVLYWLEKMRNWQEKYNPIDAPTPWTDLTYLDYNGVIPSPEIMSQRGAACFLFRTPAIHKSGGKPINPKAIDTLWRALLGRLEKQCAENGEVLDDGTPLEFVNPEKTRSWFPLHALRVSLITYYILDLQLPIAVVSKLIAGHASIIMTLYYVKYGAAKMREVLAEAEKKEFEAEQANHRRFLQEASLQEVSERFAYISMDAVENSINTKAAGFVFDDKGICPNGATMCDVGGEKLAQGKQGNVYSPVPGYPQQRNCVACRFFLTGPAFIPGLTAHFNAISERAHYHSGRYKKLEQQMRELENIQRDAERENKPFLRYRELEQIAKHTEGETMTLQKYINDMQATNYLVQRSLEIAQKKGDNGLALVASGNMSDISAGFIEADSLLHQLEVICENAVIYPDIDAGWATIRRSQILDVMLRYNEIEPIMIGLTEEQQLLVGNEVMKLIQARTGSLRGALPYAECQAKLKDIGITNDAVVNAIKGICASDLLNQTKKPKALRPPKEDSHDGAS